MSGFVPDTHELAWAAGFFDGEGHFAFGLRGKGRDGTRCHVAARLAQVDRRVLDRFQIAVGGLGRIYGPYVSKNPNSQPQFQFGASGFMQTQAVFALLWRWLSPVKREQGKKALTGFIALQASRKAAWAERRKAA